MHTHTYAKGVQPKRRFLWDSSLILRRCTSASTGTKHWRSRLLRFDLCSISPSWIPTSFRDSKRIHLGNVFNCMLKLKQESSFVARSVNTTNQVYWHVCAGHPTFSSSTWSALNIAVVIWRSYSTESKYRLMSVWTAYQTYHSPITNMNYTQWPATGAVALPGTTSATSSRTASLGCDAMTMSQPLQTSPQLTYPRPTCSSTENWTCPAVCWHCDIIYCL